MLVGACRAPAPHGSSRPPSADRVRAALAEMGKAALAIKCCLANRSTFVSGASPAS
jgi:hypothetical protein